MSSPVEVRPGRRAPEPSVNRMIDARYNRFAPRRRAAQAVTGITAASASR